MLIRRSGTGGDGEASPGECGGEASSALLASISDVAASACEGELVSKGDTRSACACSARTRLCMRCCLDVTCVTELSVNNKQMVPPTGSMNAHGCECLVESAHFFGPMDLRNSEIEN